MDIKSFLRLWKNENEMKESIDIIFSIKYLVFLFYRVGHSSIM